ncbi:TLC domain-containing protein [Mrakia frigida]|uniref:TLC domain-containing protein n=1 Tax=Mrakia frigida TaxID=29902 RepID=UPI003FCC166D
MSTPSSTSTPVTRRRRSSSAAVALNAIPSIGGANSPLGPETTSSPLASSSVVAESKETRRKEGGGEQISAGQWDIPFLRWLKDPLSTFLVIANIAAIHWATSTFVPEQVSSTEPFLFLSYPVKGRPGFYTKGYKDLAFLSYYFVCWWFLRDACSRIFPILARKLGISKQNKIDRFTEQAYTAVYSSLSTVAGVYVMVNLPTNWYKTSAFFEHYENQYQMPGHLKAYYLLQSAFWTQQFLILALRMEKPRDDFTELAFHHAVTAYLIVCSYFMNLTLIGNAIFLSMDISDAFLAIAKCINYTEPAEIYSSVAFASFVVVWSYFRHFLNLKILWNVWDDVKRIEPQYRIWDPSRELFAPNWVVWQIFTPIALLQLVNLFWYWRIWIILIKAIRGIQIVDDREDGEEDEPSVIDSK